MQLRSWLFPVVLALAAGAGCGDDGKPPSGYSDAGPGVDAGPRDAGPAPSDAGSMDAGPLPDGSTPDGSAPGDGGVLPCETPSTLDLIDLSSDTLDDSRRVAVAPGVDRFVVAWHEMRDGREDIFARVIPTTGDPPAEVRITDDFAISRAPAVVDNGSSVLLAWYDNSAAGFEIFAQSRTASLAEDGAPVRLTDNSLRDDSPVLVPYDGNVLAGWVESDLADTVNAVTRLLGTDGTPAGAAHTISPDGTSPASPRLAHRLGGGLVSWYELSGGSADAVIMPLDTSGDAAGTPVGLTTEHNASGAVDIAQLDTRGAAVFDVAVDGTRPEVRFRPLDDTGAPAAPERIVTMAPERGLDASVAAFRGGWVVAYRALEDEGLSSPAIRIAFLDVFGDVVSTVDVDTASAQSSPTEVAVASDGTLLVGWVDVETGVGSTMRAARVRCD